MAPPPGPRRPTGMSQLYFDNFFLTGQPPPAPTPKPDYFTPTFPPKSVLFDSLFFSNFLRNHATAIKFVFKIIKYLEKYPKYHTPHFRQKLKKKKRRRGWTPGRFGAYGSRTESSIFTMKLILLSHLFIPFQFRFLSFF